MASITVKQYADPRDMFDVDFDSETDDVIVAKLQGGDLLWLRPTKIGRATTWYTDLAADVVPCCAQSWLDGFEMANVCSGSLRVFDVKRCRRPQLQLTVRQFDGTLKDCRLGLPRIQMFGYAHAIGAPIVWYDL